jgi:vanillate O-demethylase monooxygenase subunit
MPVVLFRQASGAVAALLDLCSHRFAALSGGLVKEGNIQCPYHGLEFDRQGNCVRNPHGDGARPASLNVRSFPVVERDNLIWIWPGSTDRADPDAIPDFGCRVDAQLGHVGGYFKIECNYKLLIDNLMDLGHVQYVHRANMQTDAFSQLTREVIVDGNSVQAMIFYPSAAPNTLTRKLLPDMPDLVDGWSDVRWSPVCATLNYVAYAPAGTAKEHSKGTYGAHLLTPETVGSTHYFYGSSRNFSQGDAAIDQVLRDWQAQALLREDRQVLEAIEARGAYARALGMKPALLGCDEAAVRVSREIARLEAAEARAPEIFRTQDEKQSFDSNSPIHHLNPCIKSHQGGVS